MSNVFVSLAWRIPCPGLRASSLFPSCQRPPPPAPAAAAISVSVNGIFSPRRGYSACRHPPALLRPSFPVLSTSNACPSTIPPSPTLPLCRAYSSVKPPNPNPKPKPKPNTPTEHGILPRKKPFAASELNAIFGHGQLPPALGNRILSVLHGRRVSGTPDLDLPADIRSVPQPTILAALNWLRAKYPVDEDAAILARVSREEMEEEDRLLRRAEEEGLYRPQSGTYGAERGEGDNPWGKSMLKEMRERNEARILKEEEEKRKEWMEGEQRELEKLKREVRGNTALQKFQDSALVEARPRADPTERPLLAWIQKHHLRATSNDFDESKMNTPRRLLPSAAVTLLTLGLCYAFAETYQPPAKEDRMWPDVPPAAATVMGIMGVNIGVFLLWRFWPPAWRLLNRYFISVPIYPYALSNLGSVFSHQRFMHLVTNMVVLWLFGTRLHDQIGRGNFLAVYLSTGALGSMTSLTAHVLSGRLNVTSLGASGALAGIFAAWCILHASDKVSPWLIPQDWRNAINAPGWVALTGIIGLEVLFLVFGSRTKASKLYRVDYHAHIGGYVSGAVCGFLLRMEREREKKTKKTKREEGDCTWFERWFRSLIS